MIFWKRQKDSAKKQNSKLPMSRKAKNILSLAVIFSFLFSSTVSAQEMKNGFYIIQMGNLNSIAGISEGDDFKINITSGETTPNLNVGTNYKVRVGFQYIVRPTDFSISVSNPLIDFGTLSPTNPITRTNTVSVSNLSAPGFLVTASENHQLLSPRNGAIIPDTTCDRGSCSESFASQWTSSLTYGFGYRCDAVSVLIAGAKSRGCVSNDLAFFYNKDAFRQFPDASKSEKAIPILKGGRGRNQKGTITYKVNISSSQPAGLYTNSITYILTPTF